MSASWHGSTEILVRNCDSVQDEEVVIKSAKGKARKERLKHKAEHKHQKKQRTCCKCCKQPLRCQMVESQLVDIGGRKLKSWYLCTAVRQRNGYEPDQVVHFETASIKSARDLERVQELLMKIKSSVNCTFELTAENLMTLNGLLNKLYTFPGVMPVAVGTALENEELKVGIYQPYYQHGSLKDRIYTSASEVPQPNQDWSVKHKLKSEGVCVEKIALYGRQILETLQYFYGLGLPRLGHVQSGNMFIHTDEDGNEVCKLGGYENTLLGYKTRLYKLYRDHLQHIDVLMFGHLVFEMAAGYELPTTELTEEDYTALSANYGETDGETENSIATVLANIFNPLKPVPKHLKVFQKLRLSSANKIPSVAEVLAMEPFCNVSTGWGDIPKVQLSDKEHHLLDLVNSGNPFKDRAPQGQAEAAAVSETTFAEMH